MATAKKAVKKSATKRPRRRLLRKSTCQEGPGEEGSEEGACQEARGEEGSGEEGREEGACEEGRAKKAEEGACEEARRRRPCEEDRQEGQIAVRQKFIGEMKARLEEERAKYLHSEETYRAEADALIEGREPGDVQFDEESARVTRLRWSVNATLRCPTRRAKPSSRSTPHSAASRPVRTASVSPQGSRSSRAPPCDPVGRRARRVQGWRTRQPSLSRLGPTRPP